MQDVYMTGSKVDTNKGITPASVPDPENLPIPCGWTILVRPYGVTIDENKTGLILPDEQADYMSYLSNVGRVVAVGPCAWTRPEHRNKQNEQFDWVQVGDFVSYAKMAGAKRKFKDVSFVLLVDDEVLEKLPDPLVLDDDLYKIDIPEDHLTKYNSIHNPNYDSGSAKGNE